MSEPMRLPIAVLTLCVSALAVASKRWRSNSKRVTHSVTPIPGAAGTEVFRYVRHADVPRFTAEGWQATPALDGTHHGEYSVLMRRIEQD